ncbi:MAG: DUF2242 domain-containing protein, partial [Rhodoferax sp.]
MTLRLVRLNRIAAAMLLAFLGGCGGGGVYKEEAYKPESPYQRTVPHSEVKACEAAQLALLSQGYRI